MARDNDRNDASSGARAHGEGQHGDKTHEAIIESLHTKRGGEEGMEASPESKKDFDEFGQPKPGHHRLTEDRQQHDPAEKDSEANRLGR
jgi:hypothetical protein